jgi:hypothetical protein
VLRDAAGFLVFTCVFIRWIGSGTTVDGNMSMAVSAVGVLVSVAVSAGPIVGGRIMVDREAFAGRLDVRKL